MNKYKFRYGSAKNMTVTIKADSYNEAVWVACDVMDIRYSKADKEPPVGWSLEMIDFVHSSKLKK